MQKILRRKNIAYSILSGILIGTSYIPFPPWAIFFCFVPLWLVWLESKSAKSVFISGWITQFMLTLIGFHWVSYTIHEFGHLPWIVAIMGQLLYCSFANLNVPMAGIVWFWLFRKSPRWAQAVSVIAVTAVMERIFPMIFDWHLGYTWLWIRWPAFQLADVFGFFGLSTITLTFNGCVLWAYLRRREQKSYWRPLAAVFIGFILLNIGGYLELQRLPAPDREAKVLVVQANIANSDKDFAQHGGGTRQFIVGKFFDLTSQALAGLNGVQPAFATWPETAFPDILSDPELTRGFPALLRSFLQAKHLNLVTGSYGLVRQKISNSMVALNADGRIASPPYAKTHLLAFGEYLPGANWSPSMKDWIPEVGDFGRGDGPQIMTLNGLKLGAQICYEGLFDSFSRELANLGAQIIVNSTNDSWYPDFAEPYQHGWMTLSRAVEIRRPLVRTTNTGISTVILASGEILTLSPRGKEWSNLYAVQYLENPPSPPFLTWGFYIFPVILGLTIALLLLIGRKQHWRERNSQL